MISNIRNEVAAFVTDTERRQPLRRAGRLREAMPDALLVTTIEQLTEVLAKIEDRPATLLFTEWGKVAEILRMVCLAVVAGSLAPGILSRAKGHNFLEPLAAGIPTLVGEWCQNWRYSVDEFISEGSLLSSPATSLPDRIAFLLSAPEAYSAQKAVVKMSERLAYHQGSAPRVGRLVGNLAVLEELINHGPN